MHRLFRLAGSTRHDPAVEAWMEARGGEVGALARHWFEVLRACGDDVREVLHDGHPTACVAGVAFAYVNAFSAHVNVGFFHGTELTDPEGLLEGTGRFMRHVKLGPGRDVSDKGLEALVGRAYMDIKDRVAAETAI